MTQTQTRYVRTLKEFVRTRIPRWRGLLLKDRTSSLLPVWPRVLPFWPSDLLLYSNEPSLICWFCNYSYSVWLGLFLVPTHAPTNSQSGASTGWMETRQCFPPSNHFHSIAYPHLLLLRNPVVFFWVKPLAQPTSCTRSKVQGRTSPRAFRAWRMPLECSGDAVNKNWMLTNNIKNYTPTIGDYHHFHCTTYSNPYPWVIGHPRPPPNFNVVVS